MKPTDQEIQDFARKFAAAKTAGASLSLTARELEIVDYSLITLVSQAELIARLTLDLHTTQIYAQARARTISGAGVGQLKALYKNSQSNDFTLDEANDRVRTVLQEISNQNQLENTVGSVAKFAVKFAPLLLA